MHLAMFTWVPKKINFLINSMEIEILKKWLANRCNIFISWEYVQ